MKNLLIVFTVLAMASVANAGLLLSVNGVVNPDDSTVEMAMSDHAVIDIHGTNHAPGAFYLGIRAGDMGALNIDQASIVYAGNATSIISEDDPDIAGFLGIDNPYVLVTLTDVTGDPLQIDGLAVDGIDFHCTGDTPENDVLISLFDGDGNLLDSQIIHQVPEPITLALMGIGGLFLRRRK